MTKCFAARQTIESSNREETAAAFRRREGLANVKDMMIDYRMQASSAAVPWAASMQVECLFPHVLDLQRAAGGGAAGEPAVLAAAKIAPWQVSRRSGRAPGEDSAAARGSAPAACNLGACGLGGRGAGG